MSLILSGTNGLSDVDGTAATPAVRGTDTNTGLFFPAADTVAASTGGTERLRLDSSGNLGLGVTPSAWNSAVRAIELLYPGSAIYGLSGGTTVTAGAYIDSVGWKYGVSGVPITRYDQGAFASGQHTWFNAASGTAGNAISWTQAMTLDSSGRLLVGTTTAADSNAMLNVYNPNATSAQIVLQNTTTGVGSNGSRLLATGNDLYITNKENGFMAFETNDTERARITTGGDFVIGKTAASESYTTGNGYGFAAATTDPFFSIVNVNGSGANGCIYLNRRNVGSASLLIAFLSNNGSSQASVGSITHNGSNTAYNTASDYRLKYDIAPMTGALAKVALLKPCTYKWNVSGADGEGFIAHELAEVCPQAVTGEKDAVNKDGSINPQGIDTSYLVATLTAAIQEQQAIIESLTARITALEAK